MNPRNKYEALCGSSNLTTLQCIPTRIRLLRLAAIGTVLSFALPLLAQQATPVVYLEPTTVVGNSRVNMASLRQDMSNAGIRVVEERSKAMFSLTVWRDSDGLHAKLRGRNGAMLWRGWASFQPDLVGAIARYLRTPGVVQSPPPARTTEPPVHRPPGPWSRQNRPLLLILSGKRRPAPFYVDAGPFAAADEHVYWSRTGPQFILITNPVGGSSHFAGQGWDSHVRLETMNGQVHAPLGEKSGEISSGMPYELARPQWVFEVKPGQKPLALYVERPKGSPDAYADGEPSPWLALGTDHVSMPFAALPPLNDIANARQHSAPVRLGQLEIRVTAVGLASRHWEQRYFRAPEHGHRFARISLAIKNVSENPNCTWLKSYETHLFDNRGYEYEVSPFSDFPYREAELLPGETMGAVISFEIWDGTTPKSLVIRRSIRDEHLCTEKQHRPVDMHGGSMVCIPITGITTAGPLGGPKMEGAGGS